MLFRSNSYAILAIGHARQYLRAALASGQPVVARSLRIFQLNSTNIFEHQVARHPAGRRGAALSVWQRDRILDASGVAHPELICPRQDCPRRLALSRVARLGSLYDQGRRVNYNMYADFPAFFEDCVCE